MAASAACACPLPGALSPQNRLRTGRADSGVACAPGRTGCGAVHYRLRLQLRQRQHEPLQSDDCQPDDCARGLAGARQSIARLSRHHAWRAHRRDLRRDVFSHLTSLSPAFFKIGRQRWAGVATDPPTPPRSRAAAVVSISTALRNFMLIAGASAMMEVSSPRRLERSSRQFR